MCQALGTESKRVKAKPKTIPVLPEAYRLLGETGMNPTPDTVE